MSKLALKLFGNPSVWADGKKITFSYRKADALLYYMILEKRASRSKLAGILWEDSDASAAMKNLRHAIYTIRKGLGMDIFLTGHLTVLELDPELDVDCDVYRFLESGDLEAYGGELLEGFSLQHSGLFEEWLGERRNLLHTRYLKQLLEAAKEAERQNELERAERLALKYVQIDPLEESAAVILMELYSRQKKFRKAIGIYHDLCKSLSEELSISPLKETTALYYRIVNEWNTSTFKLEEQSYRLLVGKDQPLRRLLSMCNGPAAEHQMDCAVIEGEAGVGKTYLLDHILNYYDFSDWLVCRSYCYQSESGTPLSPWNSIVMALMTELETRGITVPKNYLKTAAGLFPCLSASVGQEYADSDWNYPVQQNYHVALESMLLIFTAVAKHHSILLVFEDIHWMDKTSSEFLGSFLRRMRNLNIMVICTTRELYPEHIRTLLENAKRDHILEVCPVKSFDREETEQFIQHYLDQKLEPPMLEEIFESTGGNALLLTQLLTSLKEHPDFTNIAPKLNDIIGYRLMQLTQEERQVMDLISVFPEGAPFEAISSILTRDTLELMYLCSQLKRRLLVQEVSRDGGLYYSLAHEQIRCLLIEQQPQSTRKILHLQVAQYYQVQDNCAPVHHYERLIYHYSQGGDHFRAFQYQVLSLNAYAGSFYAVMPTLTGDSDSSGPQNVSDHFRSLEDELVMLRGTAGREEQLNHLEAILLHAKSCYCVYMGLYDEGLKALDRLVELCRRERNDQLLVRAHLQYIYYGIQKWEIPVMEEHLRAGMELLKGQEKSEEFGIYLRMEGLFEMMLGNYALSREICRKSIDTFRQLVPEGDDRYAINIAGAYNYIAESYRLEESFDQAFLAYDQAIIYNRSRGYYPGAAVFYTNYGVAAYQKGEKQIAQQLFLFALETYRAANEYSGRPIALSYLALYEAEQEHYDQAEQYIIEAHQVSDTIGSPWWKGITLYKCWKIRKLLDSKGHQAENLRRLWPQSPLEHCQLCLACLHQMQPGIESREMESELEKLK